MRKTKKNLKSSDFKTVCDALLNHQDKKTKKEHGIKSQFTKETLRIPENPKET